MKYINLLLLLLLNLYSNSFESETSPYLRQHADNPVNWHAWNEKSLALAKKENKPIFVSIGYSTCHWCHVMAEESFENEELAELFNRYFISIKVDREEMPHLDSYYQEMHKRVKGHSGGWPLNIFMTPDKEVFYMSAYIPPKSVREYVGLETLLPSLHNKFSKNLLDEDIEKYLTHRHKKISTKGEGVTLKRVIESIDKSYDDLSSGFGDTTKFPEASKVELMFDLALLAKSERMYENSLEMLDVMAMRGLYDHVEGGFFRYAVDVDWNIPHFEKMLYTQAEMVSTYSRAFSLTQKELYRSVVIETIDMVDRRFLDKDLYLSASDAGRGLDEGKYFVFSKEEIESALDTNSFKEDIRDSISSLESGNFKSQIHLGFDSIERPKGFEEFKDELKKVRSDRNYPFIDRKINTAWNALMIEALYRASVIDKKYIQKADRHLKALKEYMFEKGELYHQSLSGLKPTQLGFLEDYAFLISALIAGYEVTFDDEKLEFAKYLLERAKSKFYKNETWYLSDDEMDIEADLVDVHYVSAHSKMIQNIIRVASLELSRDYERLSKESLESISEEIVEKLSDTPAALRAYLMSKKGVVTLKNKKEVLLKDIDRVRTLKYPYIVLKKDDYGKYLACTMKRCFSIEESFESIKKSIDSRQYN